jgi:hypothetical protein
MSANHSPRTTPRLPLTQGGVAGDHSYCVVAVAEAFEAGGHGRVGEVGVGSDALRARLDEEMGDLSQQIVAVTMTAMFGQYAEVPDDRTAIVG